MHIHAQEDTRSDTRARLIGHVLAAHCDVIKLIYSAGTQLSPRGTHSAGVRARRGVCRAEMMSMIAPINQTARHSLAS